MVLPKHYWKFLHMGQENLLSSLSVCKHTKLNSELYFLKISRSNSEQIHKNYSVQTGTEMYDAFYCKDAQLIHKKVTFTEIILEESCVK